MKLLIFIFFPLLTSLICYIFSSFFGFDYCSGVKEGAVFLNYSGVEYLSSKPIGCVFHGSLISLFVFIFPFSVYIYYSLNVKKIESTGKNINIRKTFLASFFIFAVYASIFLSPIESYSSRGAAAVDLIFGNYFLFYLFMIFPCQLLIGLWVLCLKLKLHGKASNTRRKC